MPDRHGLIRRQVDHRLGGEEAEDPALRAKLGAEDLLVDNDELWLSLLVFLVVHSIN